MTPPVFCSAQSIWDEQDVRNKLRAFEDGFDFMENFFIHCLYGDFVGDPNDSDMGFLRSHLLVKTFKHIFTSPSSAKAISLDDENVSRPPKAARTSSSKKKVRKDVASGLQMTKVTPRALAYAATQLVFALSNADNWCNEHQGFSFCDFYYFVIDYFEGHDPNSEDPDDVEARREARKLLKWWNDEIFPHSVHSTGATQAAVSATSMQMLKEQRAAKRASRASRG